MSRNESDESRWDRTYSGRPKDHPQPDPTLVSVDHLLPTKGRALDLACGVGGNALWLAARGLKVDAWDISGVALTQLTAAARTKGLEINTRKVDLNQTLPAAGAWDLIVVNRFLDRSLAGPISAALTEGGILFYQTFTRERVVPGGPGNPDFLLRPNELLTLFPTLHVLLFHDEAAVGDTGRGLRNQSCLVACRMSLSS
jgi:tellurite methyltransferase